MKKSFVVAFLGASLAFVVAWQAAGQQPSSNQIVIQAANAPGSAPAQPAAAKNPGTTVDDSAAQTLLKEFQDAKKKNDELLRKQEATLSQLDDLQKAAEQLKIFAKRV